MSRSIKQNPAHWLRKPHTFQEHRLNLAQDEEHPVRIRAKRNQRHLPSAWEDQPVHRTSFQRRKLIDSILQPARQR